MLNYFSKLRAIAMKIVQILITLGTNYFEDKKDGVKSIQIYHL
jgi:hypothetical protein